MNNNNYLLLPFNFKKFDGNSILLVNNVGDYFFLPIKDFDRLLAYSLKKEDVLYQDLKSRHFIADTDLVTSIELLANKYRTKKSFLRSFTALHMMVITLRCNHKCDYCQVASELEDSYRYDMTSETSKAIVDYIFKSPSPSIKIEFQGGEPLLNWGVIVSTVEYAEKLNNAYKKDLEFVVCTNLTLVDEPKAVFIEKHNISISTSLDGPKEIHDKHRIRKPFGSSYDGFVDKLKLCREEYGINDISALMTTTVDSLTKIKEIIDEYVKLGFNGIFLRALNPYGEASIREDKLGYSVEEFTASYNSALRYIIGLNINGTKLIEHYTALLLYKILTPFSSGFVDLQSPSGAGISGVIYDYNGDVYPADEARMLARMGDKYFLMGNVLKDRYTEIFNGNVIKEIVKKSCIEAIPQCASCVYQPFCGGDPVRNYLELRDVIGHRPSSFFCEKHIGIFDIIFRRLKKNDPEEMGVLWSWIT